MAQQNVFYGNLASDPVFDEDKNRGQFTLISNEYAGKDKPERTVAIQFTAFGNRAKALAENKKKGDSLYVEYRVENNNYEKDGQKIYSYNFVVEDLNY